MKLNGKKLSMQSYISESVDDKTILYSEDAQKVIVVNNSASIIWEKIKDSYQKNRDLSTAAIADDICSIFNIGDNHRECVCNDIDETIASFFAASLITYSDE